MEEQLIKDECINTREFTSLDRIRKKEIKEAYIQVGWNEGGKKREKQIKFKKQKKKRRKKTKKKLS